MDVTVSFPPGAARGASPAEIPGRWFDTHLVRWVGKVLRPHGGFARQATDPLPEDGFYKLTDGSGAFLVDGDGDFLGVDVFSGKMRAIHNWTDNDGVEWTGILCDDRILVDDGSGVLVDITPVGGMTGPSADLLAGGYGDGDYGADEYGTPRPERERPRSIGPAFSITNWGQNLLAMTSYDGRLLMWVPNSLGDSAEAVVGAPVSNRSFVVTESRHVVMFGVGGNFRRWGWCSQEDINDWDFGDITNTAGFYDIEPASPFVSAVAVKDGVFFFTSSGPYYGPYIGAPDIFANNSKGNGMVPIAHGAMTTYLNGVVWMGESQMWTFDGSSISPVDCEIIDWFGSVCNKIYAKYRISSFEYGAFPEVWFNFPETGESENTANLIWNYVTNICYMSYLPRSCGHYGKPSYPLMSDGRSLYAHEQDDNYYGDVELPYAESSAINLNSGANFVTIHQCIPDHGAAHGDVRYTFYGRRKRVEPRSTDETVKGPLTTRADGWLDVGFKARDHRMRIQMARNGAPDFTFGQMLAKTTGTGSKR